MGPAEDREQYFDEVEAAVDDVLGFLGGAMKEIRGKRDVKGLRRLLKSLGGVVEMRARQEDWVGRRKEAER